MAAARRRLDRLLRPRSVAIVGASDKPGALGASVLANLERQGFAGDIHLINPKRAEIGGRPCLASDRRPARGRRRRGAGDPARGGARYGAGAGGAQGAARRSSSPPALPRAARRAGRAARDSRAIAAEAGMVDRGAELPRPGQLRRRRAADLRRDADDPAERPARASASSRNRARWRRCSAPCCIKRDLGLSHSVSTGNEAASGRRGLCRCAGRRSAHARDRDDRRAVPQARALPCRGGARARGGQADRPAPPRPLQRGARNAPRRTPARWPATTR